MATWRDQNLFVLPMTSERSLLATAGDMTAQSTGSYPDIITTSTSLGTVGILDLLQHPSPQPGHWNTYSLGLRSERKHTGFTSKETGICFKPFPLSLPESKLSQPQRQWHQQFWYFRLLPGYSPHSLAEISVGSDPAALAKAFRCSSIPTW